MKQRCQNPKFTHYKHYGGRGITVCPEWEEWIPFRDWALANGYQKHLQIDRKETNGNYEPSNCRWVTATVNNSDRRKFQTRKGKPTTSQYIGVHYNKSNSQWVASVRINGKLIYLGYHDTEIKAARIREAYIQEHNLPHTLNNV